MIKLVIADDNPLIREGIKRELSNSADIEIVGMASTGKEAIQLSIKHNPDIVLMDIRMPEMDGLEAAKKIKEINKNVKVIISSSHFEQEYLQKAMEYNCNGYVDKDTETEFFTSIIKNVTNGFDVWSGKLDYKTGVVSIKNDEDNKEDLKGLSDQELRMIGYVVRGTKLNDIAKEMNYSDCYVRQLMVKLNEKVGVKNTREMAVWGARHGL